MNGFLPPYAKPQGLEQFNELLADIRLVVLDFDGVLTDNAVYVTQGGVESVRGWRSDGIGLTRMRGLGVHVLILSTEVNPVVTARANKLKITCKQGVEDKAAAILDTCQELGIDPLHAVFIGNDINDDAHRFEGAVPLPAQDGALGSVRIALSERGSSGTTRRRLTTLLTSLQASRSASRRSR